MGLKLVFLIVFRAVSVPQLGNPVRTVSWGLLPDQGSGWDHLEMLSLAYPLLRCLFGLLAMLVRPDLSKDAELLVLRHENRVPRRQLRGRLQ